MKKKYIFLLIIVLQVLVLVFMATSKQRILDYGDTVILKVQPIDPRDMFRGDYVRLSYDISVLERKIFSDEIKETNFNDKRPIYVALEKNDFAFNAVNASFEKPKTGFFIKGFIRRNGFRFSQDTINMHYGLDSYFVPEGTGLKWENLARDAKLYAEIKVDKNGNAVISKLTEK